MTDLTLPDGSVGGCLLWYSLIHVPDAEILRQPFDEVPQGRVAAHRP
jgi:hypothetical protein